MERGHYGGRGRESGIENRRVRKEMTRELGVDPQADFFRIYGWLIKIYGCFSAMPQNCGEGNLWLKIRNLWLLFG